MHAILNVHNYSEFRQDMKTRPLFGICPLFGVSVKREFTVVTKAKDELLERDWNSTSASKYTDLSVFLRNST